MDGDSARVQDELRRSRREEQSPSVRGSEEYWRYGLILPGAAPLAGAPGVSLQGVEGQGNSPVRAAAMRNAQSTYGNRSVQRFLRDSPPRSHTIPIQRVLLPGEITDDMRKLGVTSAYGEGPSDDSPNITPTAPNIAVPTVPTVPDIALPAAITAPSIAPLAAANSADFGGWAKHGGKWTQDASYSAAPTNPAIAAGGTPPFKHKSLLDDYEDEDIAAHGYETADNVTISTKYMTEQERRPYEVSVGEGGRLYQGSKALETDVDNARTGLRAQGSAGGHLYAMSPQGQIYSADMASEWEKGGMQGPDATVKKKKGTYYPTDPNASSAEATTFHHSSFLAGGAVAGAGEIKVHEGLLSMISNASGHYRPEPEYVMQTLSQLEAGGAAVDQARVRLMGDLTGQGYDASKEVTAAVGEFKQAGGSRDELLKRHRVLGELSGEFGVGVADSGPLKGIQMEPPDSGDIGAAQKDVLASLGQKNPFARAFRDTRRAEGEVEEPTRYGDFMKRATGRDLRPKPKKPFSFSDAAPSIAPASAPSIAPAPTPQAYRAYADKSDDAPSTAPSITSAPTSAPAAYTAYGSQSESEPAPSLGFAYSAQEAQEVEAAGPIRTVDSAYATSGLSSGYVTKEEAGVEF